MRQIGTRSVEAIVRQEADKALAVACESLHQIRGLRGGVLQQRMIRQEATRDGRVRIIGLQPGNLITCSPDAPSGVDRNGARGIRFENQGGRSLRRQRRRGGDDTIHRRVDLRSGELQYILRFTRRQVSEHGEDIARAVGRQAAAVAAQVVRDRADVCAVCGDKAEIARAGRAIGTDDEPSFAARAGVLPKDCRIVLQRSQRGVANRCPRI